MDQELYPDDEFGDLSEKIAIDIFKWFCDTFPKGNPNNDKIDRLLVHDENMNVEVYKVGSDSKSLPEHKFTTNKCMLPAEKLKLADKEAPARKSKEKEREQKRHKLLLQQQWEQQRAGQASTSSTAPGSTGAGIPNRNKR